MNSHEIFLHLPPTTAGLIFSELLEKEKPLYKATIETLTKQRKLRPVFIERKPRLERHAWMQDALSRRANDAVAAHLLQIWLVSTKAALLCDFLDGLGIAHDENGTIEEMPPAPEKEKLAPVIDSLFAKYDPGIVLVYLQAFQALDEHGWPSLAELLETDERLRLGPVATPAP
jgi:hypothetical protein